MVRSAPAIRRSDCSHEGFKVAIEARGDAPPVFEAAEHAFDDVALLVDGLVVIVLGFAVFARWDDCFGASRIQPFAQGLTVIALIRDEFGRRWHGLDATLCDLAVMYVSGRQEQDAGSPLLIADGMELGVAAAFGAADTMSQGPPFPPPAQR